MENRTKVQEALLPRSRTGRKPLQQVLCEDERHHVTDAEGKPLAEQPLPWHDMKPRLRHILEHAGLDTWKDLLSLSADGLRHLEGMGKTSLEQLAVLVEHKAHVRPVFTPSPAQQECVFAMMNRLPAREQAALRPALEEAWMRWLQEHKGEQADEACRNPDLMLERLLHSAPLRPVLEGLLQEACRTPQSPEMLGMFFSGKLVPVLLEQIVPAGLQAGWLFQTPLGLVFAQMSFDAWLDSLPEKARKVCTWRFCEGLTLEECGDKAGLTRERVRQIAEKQVQNAPRLPISWAREWFEAYDISLEAGRILFGFSSPEIRFLHTLCGRSTKRKDPEEMVQSAAMTPMLYERYKVYLHRHEVRIDGHLVLRQRRALLKFLAREHCSHQTLSLQAFHSIYQACLESLGLQDDPAFDFPGDRAFEANLFKESYIITSGGHTLRYYETDREAWLDAARKMGLEDFHNVEISARLIFQDHPELMKRLDIHDAYELHNILRKTESQWNEGNRLQVRFGRSPMIAFGQADRAEQMIRLMEELAPISKDALAAAYSARYGDAVPTILANALQPVQSWLDHGLYRIDLPVFDGQEVRVMKEVLADQAAGLEWIRQAYRKAFPQGDLKKINARSLKACGFRTYSGYALPDGFSSAQDWLAWFACRTGQFHFRTGLRDLSSVSQFSSALGELRSRMDIFETDWSEYASSEVFLQAHPGLSTGMLEDYLQASAEFARSLPAWNDFSLRQAGFAHPVYACGLSSFCLDLLRKNRRQKPYLRVGSGLLFFEQQTQLFGLLQLSLEETPGQSVQALAHSWQMCWNIHPRPEKLQDILRRAGFYQQENRWYVDAASCFESQEATLQREAHRLEQEGVPSALLQEEDQAE